MRRPLPSLLALALTALPLVACGDSDDDPAETTTTTPAETSAPDTTSPASDDTDDDAGSTGGPTGDAIVDQLVALGFEEGEASCLAGELAEGGLDPSALAEIAEDPTVVLAAVEACDIPLTRLLELAQNLGITQGTGGGSGGSAPSLEESFVESFVESMGGSGSMSEVEARCIAEELLAQGGDVSGAAELAGDLESLGSVLEGCGVSASDVGG
jgi:hypothetical protein